MEILFRNTIKLNLTTLNTRLCLAFLIGFSFSYYSNGRELKERVILTDSQDSLYLKSYNISFDRNGNYCIVIEKEGQDYFVTNNDTIGGFRYVGSRSGVYGTIITSSSPSNLDDNFFYYKNSKGTKIYGPAIGRIHSYQTSNTRENIALNSAYKDSVYYYINNELVNRVHNEQVEKFYITNSDWVSFSPNGNVIYFLNKESIFKLFVNEKLIDSSKFRFTQLAINNTGNFIFAKGEEPEHPMNDYNYKFYINTIDTNLGYVRTVWDYELKDDGAYYYSGDDNGPDYIAINDKLHRNIETVSNINLIDKNTYLYTFEENGKSKINVNGRIYSHDFEEVFYPSLDKNGNFAFFGMRDYYLYKYVSGQEITKPLSEFGVRATPLYMSPKGESIHYFKTDDSIYLYRDENLVFKQSLKTSDFITKEYNEFLPYNYIRGKTEGMNSLFYLEYNQDGYLVYNGNFSNPLTPIKNRNYSKEKKNGAVVIGELNDNGFFAIQKTGERKFLLIINNEIYKEINGIDYIVRDSFFFEENRLIFYAVKNYSFYQYTMEL